MNRFFYLNQLQFNQESLLVCYHTNKNAWARYGKKDLKYAEKSCGPILDIVNQFKDPSIIKNIKFFKTIAKGHVSPICNNEIIAEFVFKNFFGILNNYK